MTRSRKENWAPRIKSFLLNSFLFIANKAYLLSITFFAKIKTKQEKSIIAMKMNDNRWKSIKSILRTVFLVVSIILIDIDYIDYWFSPIGHAGSAQRKLKVKNSVTVAFLISRIVTHSSQVWRRDSSPYFRETHIKSNLTREYINICASWEVQKKL